MKVTPILTTLGLVGSALLGACDQGENPGEPLELTVPSGASFGELLDTLVAREIVGSPRLFTLYARAKGADRQIRSGRYRVDSGASWGELVEVFTEGRILPTALTIPEGWTLRQMVPRVADVAGVPQEEVASLLLASGDSLAEELGVPGPGLEGYLFPDTYLFAEGIAPREVVVTMAEAYQSFWTEARRAQLEASGRSEHEVVTLASIVQAEAGNEAEMPVIASVYSNRLESGWLLQADPTVLYALGGTRERLLFAAIDSVADNPYNTYTQPGLPPGPIGSPGRSALEAALNPADTDYMFFVAGPDGGHVFSRTLAEHNRAVAEYRRRRAAQRGQDRGP
jgi:UPF0755 protein